MAPPVQDTKTSDIDDQIEDKIDELIDGLSGKDYEPVSFTSSKNTDIGLVQFAIHTEAISRHHRRNRSGDREARQS